MHKSKFRLVNIGFFVFISLFFTNASVGTVKAESSPYIQWETVVNGTAKSVVLDSTGNPLVAGEGEDGYFKVTKYSGDTGEELWTSSYNLGVNNIGKVKINPDGSSLTSGTRDQEINCTEEGCLTYPQSAYISYSHDPNNIPVDQIFGVFFNAMGIPSVAISNDSTMFLAAGQVFDEDSYEVLPASRLSIYKINSGDFDEDTVLNNFKITGIMFDSDGAPIFIGQTFDVQPQGRLMKYNLETKTAIWDVNIGNYIPNGNALEQNNDIVISAETLNGVKLFRYNNADGTENWNAEYIVQSTEIHLGNVVIDLNGDYLVTGYATVNGEDEIRTVKIDRSTGSKVWDISAKGNGARSSAVAVGSDGKPVIVGQNFVMKLFNSPSIDNLVEKIEQMYADGQITKLGTSLTDKLRDAQIQIDAGNLDEAKKILNSLVKQIEAQTGRHITQQAADVLIEQIKYILSTFP